MKGRLLVIDDERSLLETMHLILTRAGYEVITASTGVEGLKILKKELESISLVITDLSLPGGFDGIDILDSVKDLNPELPVIMITAYGSVEIAVKAMQKGAFNFLTKPVNFKVLNQQVEKGLETATLRQENKLLKRKIEDLNKDKYKIIYASSKMEKLLKNAAEFAKTEETVLITGESGTGKELLAHHILKESTRAEQPFIAFNAAAVHENLMEAELFGYKKGAFTGADRNSPGYIGSAQGGTLFIDEIGEMPLNLQSKMLRFLQEKEFMPVGSSTPQKADVRIIAATNKNLEKESALGSFRQDLYYRLARFTVHIPALRERKEDIKVLSEHFIQKLSHQYKKNPVNPSESLINRLTEKDWTGNVRELENFIARYILSADEKILEKEEDKKETLSPIISFKIGEKSFDELEKEIIQKTLKYTDGNKNKAAELLGISQRTIYRKITEEEV